MHLRLVLQTCLMEVFAQLKFLFPDVPTLGHLVKKNNQHSYDVIIVLLIKMIMIVLSTEKMTVRLKLNNSGKVHVIFSDVQNNMIIIQLIIVII